MRYLFVFSILILFATLSKGQDNKAQQKNPYDVNFKVVTQQEPSYPAGDNALYSYLYNNIKYSDEAKEKNVSGNVMISFNVMPDSTLSDIMVLAGVGYGVDEELVRLIKPLKYIPGIQNSEKTKMNVILTIPIKIK